MTTNYAEIVYSAPDLFHPDIKSNTIMCGLVFV